MCDDGSVELQSGIGTELPWRLQYAHGLPTLHSLSTVSRHRSYTISSKDLKAHPDILYRHRTGEEFYLHDWGFRGPPIHFLQIHVAWVPTDGVCEVLYTSTETFTSTIITMFSADVVLLLTMLVGLLRLRHEGTMFGLGKFLWSQVSCWGASPLPL